MDRSRKGETEVESRTSTAGVDSRAYIEDGQEGSLMEAPPGEPGRAAELVITHRSEPKRPSRVDRGEQLARIGSFIAIPLLIAFLGWRVDDVISRRSADTEFVKLAISILGDPDATEALKPWAVDLLKSTSPTPLSENVANQLSTGEIKLSQTAAVPQAAGDCLAYLDRSVARA